MFCTSHPLQTTRKHHDERTVTTRTSLGSEMLTLLSHPTRLILQSPNSPTPSLPGRWVCKSWGRDQLFDGLRTHMKPGARVRLAGRRATFFLPARGGRVRIAPMRAFRIWRIHKTKTLSHPHHSIRLCSRDTKEGI